MPEFDLIADICTESDLTTPQGRGKVAAKLTRGLADSVARLWALYDAADEENPDHTGGGVMNDEQPDQFGSVLAGSLDEWWHALHGVAAHWDIIAQTPPLSVIVHSGGPPETMRLSRFLILNEDGIDAAERVEIVAKIAAGEEYHGGGGAAAAWSLYPVEKPPAPPAWRPVKFTFDEAGCPTFEGETRGDTWNGWPVVRVTGAERVKLALWSLNTEGADAAEYVAHLLAAPSDAGEADRYTLNGFTPYIPEA